MTFLFRLDVCACGGGGNEGFSHSVCLYVCACLCPHAQACPCERPNYNYTASFCGSLQYCPNGLRSVYTLSAIFRDYLFFLKLSGFVSEVDRKWGRGNGDIVEEGGEWWVGWCCVSMLATTGDTGVCVYLCVCGCEPHWQTHAHTHPYHLLPCKLCAPTCKVTDRLCTAIKLMLLTLTLSSYSFLTAVSFSFSLLFISFSFDEWNVFVFCLSVNYI